MMGMAQKYNQLTGMEVEEGQQSRWRGHMLACCGDCGPLDVISCILGCNSPWAAYGWNAHKVLQRSFWREGGIFLGLTIGWLLLYELSTFTVSFTCSRAIARDDTAALEQPLCGALHNGMLYAFALGMVATWVATGILMGHRRRLLRQKLGLQQRGCNDYAAHLFCNTCANVQETRTILHMEANGVLAKRLLGDSAHLIAPINEQAMERV